MFLALAVIDKTNPFFSKTKWGKGNLHSNTAKPVRGARPIWKGAHIHRVCWEAGQHPRERRPRQTLECGFWRWPGSCWTLASTHAADLGKESWMLDNAFLIFAGALQDWEEFCDWPTPTLPVHLHPCGETLVQGRIPPAIAQPTSIPPGSILFVGWPQKAGRDFGFPYEVGHRKKSHREGHGQSPVITCHRDPIHGKCCAAVRGKVSDAGNKPSQSWS